MSNLSDCTVIEVIGTPKIPRNGPVSDRRDRKYSSPHTLPVLSGEYIVLVECHDNTVGRLKGLLKSVDPYALHVYLT